MNMKKVVVMFAMFLMSLSMVLAAYNETYSTADLSDLAIDTGGSLFANFLLYAGIIVLAVVGLFIWKRAKQLGKVFLFFLAGVGGLISKANDVLAYDKVYEVADFSKMFVDFIGTYLYQIVSLSGIIVVVLVAGWFMKRAKSI
jgi:hypothetical protein